MARQIIDQGHSPDEDEVMKGRLLDDDSTEPRFRIRVSSLISALFIAAGLVAALVLLFIELKRYFGK